MIEVIIAAFLGGSVSTAGALIKDSYLNHKKMKMANRNAILYLRNQLRRVAVDYCKWVSTETINYIDNYDAIIAVGGFLKECEEGRWEEILLDNDFLRNNMTDISCLDKFYEMENMILEKELEFADYADILSLTEPLGDKDVDIKCHCKYLNLCANVGLSVLEFIEYIECRYKLPQSAIRVRGNLAKEVFRVAIDKTEEKYKFSSEKSFSCEE